MRFPHDQITSQTGAVRLHVSQHAYPVLISVRPPTAAPTTMRGGFKSMIPIGQDAGRITHGGTDIDCVIRDCNDRHETGSEPYLHLRHARSETKLDQIQAPRSPETDIYQRAFCSKGCGAEVTSIGPCAACQPPDLLCTAPNRRADGSFAECMSHRMEPFSVCRAHAEEQGLIAAPKPAATPENACVWSGCASARYKAYVMCAEHAIEAGLVGQQIPQVVFPDPKPEIPTVPAIAGVGGKSVASTAPQGVFGRHRADCACRICTSRRKRAMDTAAIADAHDEVASVAPVEEDVVLSGVDSAEGGL